MEDISLHGYGWELVQYVDRIRATLPPDDNVEETEEDVIQPFEIEEEDLEVDVEGSNERLSKHERKAIEKGNNDRILPALKSSLK